MNTIYTTASSLGLLTRTELGRRCGIRQSEVDRLIIRAMLPPPLVWHGAKRYYLEEEFDDLQRAIMGRMPRPYKHFIRQRAGEYLSPNGRWRIERQEDGWYVYDLVGDELDPPGSVWGFWGENNNNKGFDNRPYIPFRSLREAEDTLLDRVDTKD